MKILEVLFVVVPILINVAFFVLLERKILGLAQSRKGPNKVSLFGLLQSIADAVKLFVKEGTFPLSSNFVFIFSPAAALMLMLMVWNTAPFNGSFTEPRFALIFLLMVLSLGLYPLLMSGWASNSKYATIGALRGVAQTLSYEVSLAVIVAVALILGSTFSGATLSSEHTPVVAAVVPPVVFLWVISAVAETNRTPFDFAEGESELVSGFNIEYSGGGFAFLFMAEYGMIMFFSLISAQIFMGVSSPFLLSVLTAILCFFWVWLRATLPRFRYDLLMSAAWKALLPASLALLGFVIPMVLL